MWVLAVHQRRQAVGRLAGLQQQNDEIIPIGEVFNVGKLSLGYIWDGVRIETFRGGLGILGSVARVPRELKGDYGDSPFSWMAFLRVKV